MLSEMHWYGQSVTTGIISAKAVPWTATTAACCRRARRSILETAAEPFEYQWRGSRHQYSQVSADSVEGMGYAIPISDASDIITDLMNQETKTKRYRKRSRGTLGSG